jgi:hypothetical protein
MTPCRRDDPLLCAWTTDPIIFLKIRIEGQQTIKKGKEGGGSNAEKTSMCVCIIEYEYGRRVRGEEEQGRTKPRLS